MYELLENRDNLAYKVVRRHPKDFFDLGCKYAESTSEEIQAKIAYILFNHGKSCLEAFLLGLASEVPENLLCCDEKCIDFEKVHGTCNFDIDTLDDSPYDESCIENGSSLVLTKKN